MARFPDLQVSDGTLAVAVLGDDDAPIRFAVQTFPGRVGHGPGRLTYRYKDQLSRSELFSGQSPSHCRIRPDLGDGLPDNGVTVISQPHCRRLPK